MMIGDKKEKPVKEKKQINITQTLKNGADLITKKAQNVAQAIDSSAKETVEKIKDSKFAESASHAGKTVSGAAAGVGKATLEAREELRHSFNAVRQKSKETQTSVLTFIDRQKNKKFIDAKLSGFEDGVKQGKIEVIDTIKKYVNYILAITALSYFFARCDGVLDDAERIEIDRDLEGIVKNKDLPKNVLEAIRMLSEKEDISFSDVKGFLDNIGNETLFELKKDVEEIINADGVVSEAEMKAKQEFVDYCNARKEPEDE